MSGADHFLARWSRLKRSAPAPAAEAVPTTEPAPEAGSASAPAAIVARAPDQADAANRDQGAASPAGTAPAVALPDPASLTLDSDFTAFLKDEVGDAVRRQALKKLFNDPHFNVMDGLDIYIGDYSVSEPIPPELLAKLRSAREWLAGREDEGDATPPAGAEEDADAAGAAHDAVGSAAGATAGGAHAPEGAAAGPAIAGPPPAAATPACGAAPQPATNPAADPAETPEASAAVTVESRR